MRDGHRVHEARLGEALLAQEARIAEAAGAAVGLGRIAGPGQGEVHPELVGAGHDLSLAQGDERGVDAEAALAFHAGLRGEIRQALEGLNELRTAIGIARVVEGVDADEDVLCLLHLGPPEGMGEEDGVARGNLGDGDVGGERGAADGAEIETQGEVRAGAEGRGHLPRRLELAHVALAIVERQRAALVALGEGDGESGRGIEATREQHDGARSHYTPRQGPHSMMWRRGEKRKPWRVHISATQGPRSISSSRRMASGWRRMRLFGRAKRSARLSTSDTSRVPVTTNFHQLSRERKSRMTAGRIRVASATPEAASLRDTFHWIARSRATGGARVPDVSTSTAKPASISAGVRVVNSGDSSGSPPVTTTRRHGYAEASRRRPSTSAARPPAASHEYLVSHQTQPTVQPCSRTNTAGRPAVTPSPWIE